MTHVLTLLCSLALNSVVYAEDPPPSAPMTPLAEDPSFADPALPLTGPEPAPAAREVTPDEILSPPKAEEPMAEAPAIDAPLPSAPVHEPARANLSTWEFDPDVPLIQRIRPRWGLRIEGGASPWTGVPGSSLRQLGLGVEFQPRVLQKVGVVSVGVGLGVLPAMSSGLTLNTAQVANLGSIWYASGSLRYQLKIVRNQWVVPMAAFHFERASYRLKSGPSGASIASGIGIGALLLLNALDPEISAQSFTESGLTRSYLFGELRMLKASGGALAYSDNALIAGLRLEFE